MAVVLLLLAGCGDSGDGGAARTAPELCDEVCGWPDQCFVELGVPIEDSTCVSDCMQSVEFFGVACLEAIADTVSCLGTCDPMSITQEDAERCQSTALGIETACETP